MNCAVYSWATKENDEFWEFLSSAQHLAVRLITIRSVEILNRIDDIKQQCHCETIWDHFRDGMTISAALHQGVSRWSTNDIERW